MTDRQYRPLTRSSTRLNKQALDTAQARLERGHPGPIHAEDWAICQANVALLRAHMAAGWMSVEAYRRAERTIRELPMATAVRLHRL